MKRLISSICVFLISTFTIFVITPSASAAVSSSGLVLHLDAGNTSSYGGSGTAWIDLSGAGNNGTLTNGPTYSAGNGKYIGFDGTNDYVNFGNITSNFSSGFSTTFYANFGATTQSWERIFDFGTAEARNNILVARAGNTDNLVIEIYNSVGGSYGQCAAASAISNNTWAHYALTLDGTNCKIYKNGNLIATNAYSGLPTNVIRTSNFIGRSNWASDGYFDLGIGEIAMYTRAITAAEVWQNFKAQADFCNTTISTSGSTRYISITAANGCLWTVPAGVTSLDYLIVGGGGGGGGANNLSVNLGAGGGGGGGAVSTVTGYSVTALTSFNLTVGSGGAGGASNATGSNGNSSSIIIGSTTITAAGGNGGQGSPNVSNQNDLSGDGGSSASGNAGGVSVWDGGGGGGGAGGTGTAGSDIGGQGGSGGAGGAGVTSAITQSVTYFGAGGGGGGTPSNNVAPASQTDGFGALGGSSVGGNGGVVASTRSVATAGSANTGSGGGGGGWNFQFSAGQRAGGAGADGIIYFRLTKATTTISSISVTSSSGGDSKYTYGETITVTVTFSETVTVTGSPRIPIQGLSSKYLTYNSSSDSPSITFTYVVTNTDIDNDGFVINANSLSLNSGSIKDTAILDCSITHLAISASSANIIDGQLLGTINSITFSGNIYYRTPVTITANVSISGNVIFRANGVKIAGCVKRAATGTSPNITATCSWKPSTRGATRVSATIAPTNNLYSSGSSTSNVFVLNRSGGR